jgi:hemoglobin
MTGQQGDGSGARVPTPSEWAGGLPAFERLFAEFYRRVPADPLLGPVFAGMSPDHAQRVSRFVNEVLHGEADYTGTGGSHARMVTRHLGRHLTHEQRRRWTSLLLECADELSLPDDPEFRSVLVGYLEWGTRLAVLNSGPDGEAPPEDAPMPRWGWGEVGGPYTGGG